MKTTFKYSLEGQETDRLDFRKLMESDFNTWLEFCKNDESIRYISLLSNLKDPEERCKAWFERVFYRYENGLGGMNVLIDKETHEFIGQCGLLIHTVDETEELEIGYSLMPAHCGKGYATEAAQKCKEFAFENGYANSLISIIDVRNDLSARVAKRNGMNLDKQTLFGNSEVNIFRVKNTMGITTQ